MLEKIEAYDVYESLGRGTYGSVYLVKRKTDRRVACVKKLVFCPGNPSVSNPSAAEASFDQEVKGLASVQHPNVVRVLGWGRLAHTDNGEVGYRPWILLEYCSQGSLKGFIDRAKEAGASRLDVGEEQVVQWVKDVLSALKELHSRGIMHRDLKPANVVVHESGVAKVCDFGVAASSEHTRHTHAGTAEYMAPQIVYETGDDYKADADMFSVGVMVLEMFTLSRIPDAQAQGGDRTSHISKLLYIWYAGDRAVARRNEDALHDDVRATLQRRVSRQWSEAVAKLVVGCLYFSRDVRLTSAAAAALLGPCSERAAAAGYGAPVEPADAALPSPASVQVETDPASAIDAIMSVNRGGTSAASVQSRVSSGVEWASLQGPEEVTLRLWDWRKELGLVFIDANVLVLAAVVDGTPAHHGGLRRYVGWRLSHVEGKVVTCTPSMFAARGNKTSILLRFVPPEAALSAATEVSVGGVANSQEAGFATTRAVSVRPQLDYDSSSDDDFSYPTRLLRPVTPDSTFCSSLCDRSRRCFVIFSVGSCGSFLLMMAVAAIQAAVKGS